MGKTAKGIIEMFEKWNWCISDFDAINKL